MMKSNKILIASKPPEKQRGYLTPVLGCELPGAPFRKWLGDLKTLPHNTANEKFINFLKIDRKISGISLFPAAEDKLSSLNISSGGSPDPVSTFHDNGPGRDPGLASNLTKDTPGIRMSAGNNTDSRNKPNTDARAPLTGVSELKIPPEPEGHGGKHLPRGAGDKTTQRRTGISKQATGKPSKLIAPTFQGKVAEIKNAAPERTRGAVETINSLRNFGIVKADKIDVPPLPSSASIPDDQRTFRGESVLSGEFRPQENPDKADPAPAIGVKSSTTAHRAPKPGIESPFGNTKEVNLQNHKMIKGINKADVPPLPSKVSETGEGLSFSRPLTSPRRSNAHPVFSNSVEKIRSNSHDRVISSRKVTVKHQKGNGIPINEKPSAASPKAGKSTGERNLFLREPHSNNRLTATHLQGNDLPGKVLPASKQSTKIGTETERESGKNAIGTRSTSRIRLLNPEGSVFKKPVTGRILVKTPKAGILPQDIEASGNPVRAKTPVWNSFGEKTPDRPSSGPEKRAVHPESKEPANGATVDFNGKNLPDGDKPSVVKSADLYERPATVWESLIMAPHWVKPGTGLVMGNTPAAFHQSLIRQLTEFLPTYGTESSGSFSLTLDAGYLGQIQMECEQSVNEHVVTLYVSSDEARASIIGIMPAVIENLSAKGYPVSQYDVRLKNFDRKGASGSRDPRPGKRNRGKVVTELSGTEAGSVLAMKYYGYNTMEVIA